MSPPLRSKFNTSTPILPSVEIS